MKNEKTKFSSNRFIGIFSCFIEREKKKLRMLDETREMTKSAEEAASKRNTVARHKITQRLRHYWLPQ